jgi:S1-C subfamily serine protease
MAELGIITQAEAASFGAPAVIRRGSMVAISRAALLAKPKDSVYSLLHSLYISNAAFDSAKLAAAAGRDGLIAQIAAISGIPAPSGRDKLDSEAVYAACSSAVFTIEVFNEEYGNDYLVDEPWNIGSGFFITSGGVAVINYHVIKDAISMKIHTTDGSVYDIEKILGYSADADIALIKVDKPGGGSFPYLRMADPHSLRAAQRIYCIGSPLGYENTISDGLVSGTIRQYAQVFNEELIQISASISNGSGGGAVINESGDVFGITTLALSGESMNIAVPITRISEISLFDVPKTLKEVNDELNPGKTDSDEANMYTITS